MTTRFQLVVIDADHLILTTEEKMSRESIDAAQYAFRLWQERGGALIIGDCLTRDRSPVFIELELDADNADNADTSPGPPGTPGLGSGHPGPSDTPRPRGLITPDSGKKPGILHRG